LEWLDDDPGFELSEGAGFFSFIITATIIMNIIIMKNMVFGCTVFGAAVRP